MCCTSNTTEMKCSPSSFWTFNPRIFVYLDLLGKLSNMPNTKKSVPSDFQTPRSAGLKKRGAAELCLTNLEVFGKWMKHSFECLT